MAELRACFRRIDVTPNRPASLLGYFNDRVSAGVLDPLHCRLAGVYRAGEALLFAQVDTCLLSAGDAEELRAALSRASGGAADRPRVRRGCQRVHGSRGRRCGGRTSRGAKGPPRARLGGSGQRGAARA